MLDKRLFPPDTLLSDGRKRLLEKWGKKNGKA